MIRVRHQITRLVFCVAFVLAAVLPANAQSGTPALTYQMPPKAIADLIDAPPTPAVSISPDHAWMAFLELPGLPSIEEVAQPELRLAGLRINPRTNGPSRVTHYSGLRLKRIEGGGETAITGLPANPKITNVSWSPDAKWLAFTLTMGDHIELWAAEVATGQAKQLAPVAVNAVYGGSYDWVSDSKSLIVLTVPDTRGAAPAEPVAPTGPVVQENLGRKTPAPTYQDLLENPHDEALFDYYATSKLVRVTLDGAAVPLDQVGIFRQATPSPDGKFILAEVVHKPYSYTVPASRFPARVEIWDQSGRMVKQLADRPLADNVPITFGSVPTGPREYEWRADADATVCWAEAQDGGDAGAEAKERDRVFMLKAPFSGDPVSLATLSLRYGGMLWGNDNLALASEWWWKTRTERYWQVKPGSPKTAARKILDFNWEDQYKHPGSPEMIRTSRGTSVLQTGKGGKSIFMTGEGASDEGNRPFIDEMDLAALTTKRLFRSEAPYYESPVALLDAAKGMLITRRESVSEPPNFFMRDLNAGSMQAITTFPHPTPQLANVQKELIRYKREDGVDLTGTLYLPEGYTPAQGPLPMLMWAYPQEFKSADAAGQVTDSPYRFVRVSAHSPLLWLVHGYAILDDPTMPIVGEGDAEPNDTYVQQLVASAKAAVDEVVRRGVADRDKIAIGGHSYGAFMTANLLAHSDLFRTGVARSGAYNRTLTPFGFQAEERTYWEAPETYYAMSPFSHAQKINEPILLIHGQADNNSGTFPIQSERMYEALKGQGATVRLVMLPHESHGYRARESVMHMVWEMTEWMDRYVKNGGARTMSGEPEDGSGQ